MIEVYHYNDLGQKLGELEFLSASETRSVNAAYTLNAAVRPRTLRKKGIAITPFTVYKHDGIFYRQLTFNSQDAETGTVNIDAVDLLFADLAERDAPEFVYNATAQAMLSALFSGTKFSVGVCDNLGTREIDIKNANKLVVLNKILELFDCELERNLLTVGVRGKIEHYIDGVPFRLEKGKNILTLDESIDTGAVITKLRYTDSTVENAPSSTITSAHINKYPVKEAYKEFKGNAAAQAQRYLEAYENPHATYKVTVPFNFKHGFKLGTVTQLYCEQIGVDLRLRVVEITKDLTGQAGDTYVLGQKAKSFVELTADLFTREDDGGGLTQEDLDRLKDEIEDGFDDFLDGWMDEWSELELPDLFDALLELKIPDIIDEIFDMLDFDDYLTDDEVREIIDEILDEELPDIIAAIVDEKLAGLDLDECDCTGGGGGNHVIIDHLPTQAEVDSYAEDSEILVYDPTNPYIPAI
nr:hypothetical protein [uncultured bacterium]